MFAEARFAQLMVKVVGGGVRRFAIADLRKVLWHSSLINYEEGELESCCDFAQHNAMLSIEVERRQACYHGLTMV